MRQAAVFLIALFAFSLALQSTAVAAPKAKWVPFGTAAWVANAGNPGYGLVTTSQGTTYGGIGLSRPPTDPASITALSFDFNPNQPGASGGSPRMVVQFSDGGEGQLRPLNWTANSWTTVEGITGNNWDHAGPPGTCGALYAQTWAAILACHVGQTITAIFVVNDSGWLYPSGEQVTLDNVTVNDAVARGPGKKN